MIRKPVIWPFQILIILIWLSMPAAGWMFAKADYAQYKGDCVHQREDCLARAELAEQHTNAMQTWADRIEMISTRDDQQAWDLHWTDLKRWHDTEASKLRKSEPLYYAQTDASLLVVEHLLRDQQKLIADAAGNRRTYNDTLQTIEGLAATIRDAEAKADYYRRQGADGIYLLLIADIDKLEDEYTRRKQLRHRLHQELLAGIEDARKLQQAILTELSMIDSRLNEDEATSYVSQLKNRFETFNPVREIGWMVSKENG